MVANSISSLPRIRSVNHPDTTSQPCVLFVDDEPTVLEGLRRMVQAQDLNWDLYFANGGRMALEITNAIRIDVMITDLRMPDMDGAELLDHIRRNHPGISRIVLSGFADSTTLNQTLGAAHQYFQKPCPSQTLIGAISRALFVRDVLRSRSFQDLVGGSNGLPVLPKVLTALLDELGSPRGSVQEVARLIGSDVALTAQVLKIVNSGFFGLSRPVTDILQGVRLLGFSTIRSVAVLGGVFRGLESAGVDPEQIETLTARSTEIGDLAQRIAFQEKMSPVEIEQSRCAGMLAHVGSLVFFANRPDCMGRLARQRDMLGDGISSDELIQFEITHAEVGAALLSLWGFPDAVVEAVLFHHRPSACDHSGPPQISPLTAVHAAQSLVKAHDAAASPGNDLDMPYLHGLGLDHRVDIWAKLAQPEPARSRHGKP